MVIIPLILHGRWLPKQIESLHWYKCQLNMLASMKLSKQQYFPNKIQYMVIYSQQLLSYKNADRYMKINN